MCLGFLPVLVMNIAWPTEMSPDLTGRYKTDFPRTTVVEENELDRSSLAAGHRQSWLILWTLEVFAACFSIACVLFMIALLATIDSKPYDSWSIANLEITPNSLLSILTTLSKSSLLLVITGALGQLKWTYFSQQPQRLYDLQIFDDASRGPLGAAQLLYNINARALVASAGAVITILALALDPFTQQVLSFPTARRPMDNSTALINIAKVFDPNPFRLELNPNKYWHTTAGGGYFSLNAAVLAGMAQKYAPANSTCRSGYCTWPTYSSLGVCNRCEDLSQSLHIDCQEPEEISLTTGAEASKETSKYVLYNKVCTFEFPNATKPFSANFTIQPVDSNNVSSVLDAAWISTNAEVEALIYHDDSPTTIAIIDTLRFDPYGINASGNSTWPAMSLKARPTALRCRLTWCEKTYAATKYENGILHDDPTGSKALEFVMEGPETGPHNGTVFAAWPTGQPMPSKTKLDVKNWLDVSGFYWINFSTVDLIRNALHYAYRNMDSQLDPSSIPDSQGAQAYLARSELYFANLTQVLDGVATSVTNTIRERTPHFFAEGTEHPLVTYVQVNWYWLIYAITVVLSGFLFLGTSIALSSERSGVVWKSSILPALLFGVKDHERPGAEARLADLRKEARHVHAWLAQGDSKNGTGLRRVVHEDSQALYKEVE